MTDNEHIKTLAMFLDEKGDHISLAILSDDPTVIITEDMDQASQLVIFSTVCCAMGLAAAEALAEAEVLAPAEVKAELLRALRAVEPSVAELAARAVAIEIAKDKNTIYEARRLLCKRRVCFKDYAGTIFRSIPRGASVYKEWQRTAEDYKARVASGEFRDDPIALSRAREYYFNRLPEEEREPYYEREREYYLNRLPEEERELYYAR